MADLLVVNFADAQGEKAKMEFNVESGIDAGDARIATLLTKLRAGTTMTITGAELIHYRTATVGSLGSGAYKSIEDKLKLSLKGNARYLAKEIPCPTDTDIGSTHEAASTDTAVTDLIARIQTTCKTPEGTALVFTKGRRVRKKNRPTS